jgi:hypothetical protein
MRAPFSYIFILFKTFPDFLRFTVSHHMVLDLQFKNTSLYFSLVIDLEFEYGVLRVLHRISG